MNSLFKSLVCRVWLLQINMLIPPSVRDRLGDINSRCLDSYLVQHDDQIKTELRPLCHQKNPSTDVNMHTGGGGTGSSIGSDN